MTNLSVNVNKVALLRNQRGDGRHVRTDDVLTLAAMLRDEFAGRIEFNVEGYPSPEFIDLICKVRPTQTTLVPDPPDVVTSDEGWDIPANTVLLRRVIGELHEIGTRVALFVEAEAVSVRATADVGAGRIELYTFEYARAFGTARHRDVLGRYVAAAALARDLGIGTNAGHDLNLENLGPFRRAIPWLLEVSIGHFLITDALPLGLEGAVGAYLAALRPEAA